MISYIKNIFIFNFKGEKRHIDLERGVNIITGDSKTGKSALIDIVDYCFGSSTSTIPKGGVIDDFGYLYGINLCINNKSILIGRRKYISGGDTSMYVKLETETVDIKKITLNYFLNQEPINLKDAKIEIERHLGIDIGDMSLEEIEGKKVGKPSIRNMVSFMFQHQNLIANKFALFYRFDDYYSRQAVIDQFPVFMGWVDDKYYNTSKRIDFLKKELKYKEVSNQKKRLAFEQVKKELIEYFKNYYSLIGNKIPDDLDLGQLLKLRKNLPSFNSTAFTSTDIFNRYEILKNDRDTKKKKLAENIKQIKALEESEKYASEYQVGLKILESKSNVGKPEKEIYECPVCGNESNEIKKAALLLNNSKEKIIKQLSNVGTYAISYKDEIASLQVEKDTILKEMRVLNSQIMDMESSILDINKQRKFYDQLIYSKAQIDLRAEQIEKEENITIEEDLDKIKREIKNLEKIKASYGLDELLARVKKFLHTNMSRIGAKLDFEDDFSPPKLWFDTSAFNLVHKGKKGEINLSEMGSGANWLSCHLSLFLTLQLLFVNAKNCKIPPVLFLDQPSQVYFPKGSAKEKDPNIIAVKKIFNTIIEEIEDLRIKGKNYPQIIITEHVDNLKLEKYDFNSFVRKRWDKNNALI